MVTLPCFNPKFHRFGLGDKLNKAQLHKNYCLIFELELLFIPKKITILILLITD